MKDAAEKAVPSFSFDAFEASDTAKMQVLDAAGNPTGWFWEFAGPGHPKTEALNNRYARERLRKAQQIEQALVGWSDVEIGGKLFAFSPEAAIEFLSHPKRVGVLTQAMEFVASEKSFTPRSE